MIAFFPSSATAMNPFLEELNMAPPAMQVEGDGGGGIFSLSQASFRNFRQTRLINELAELIE